MNYLVDFARQALEVQQDMLKKTADAFHRGSERAVDTMLRPFGSDLVAQAKSQQSAFFNTANDWTSLQFQAARTLLDGAARFEPAAKAK